MIKYECFECLNKWESAQPQTKCPKCQGEFIMAEGQTGEPKPDDRMEEHDGDEAH